MRAPTERPSGARLDGHRHEAGTLILKRMTDGEELGSTLGEAIRRQRELAELPLRQLAEMVGISNPYLSQIEHGLRFPSEHVLEAIAESLHTTADALSPQFAEGEADAEAPVLAAIRDDHRLTASQRQALAEVYRGLVEATAARRHRGRGRA